MILYKIHIKYIYKIPRGIKWNPGDPWVDVDKFGPGPKPPTEPPDPSLANCT